MKTRNRHPPGHAELVLTIEHGTFSESHREVIEQATPAAVEAGLVRILARSTFPRARTLMDIFGDEVDTNGAMGSLTLADGGEDDRCDC
jgi:hypothetical protein